MPPALSTKEKVLDIIYERNRRESAESLDLYLKRVLIDCLPEPAPFGSVMEPWQVERNNRIVPAFEFVAGLREDYSGPMNLWEGFAKGHDKTSFIARLLNWALRFAKRRGLRCYVGAKDAEQAAVLKDAMIKEANLNKWFADGLDFTKNTVKGKYNNSELHILASDAGGSQGKNPDIIICDELTVWKDFKFFDTLFSGAGKRGDRTGRQRCLFAVLTNAGYLRSWQDDIRQLAKKGNGINWSFYEQPVGPPVAKWISTSVLQTQMEGLSEGEGKRLWYNQWIDENEEKGIFRPEDVDCCILPPTPPPPEATVYLCVDYGEVRDRTALAALWYDGEIVHVTELTVWQGSKQFPVQIEEINSWLERRLSMYPNCKIIIDKDQLIGTEQKFVKKGYEVKRFQYRGGTNNFKLAENLRVLVSNKKIKFTGTAGLHPDGTTLADELKRVIMKRKSYGYRIDHDSGEHDDRVITVGMAALEAVATSPPLSTRQLKTNPALLNSKNYSPVGGGFSTDHLSRRSLFGC